MNLIKRTCATCCAFDPPHHVDDRPACSYMMDLLVHHVDRHGRPMVIRRQPYRGFCCDSHHTREENTAQAQILEAKRPLAGETHEFMTAVFALLRMIVKLGHYHPNIVRLKKLTLFLALPSMNAYMAEAPEILKLCLGLGLDQGLVQAQVLEAYGYTDDGEPVVSLQAIAEKLGIGMHEAQGELEAMLADREKRGLPATLVDLATVHRKH